MPFAEFNKLPSFRLRERLPIAVAGLEIFHGKGKQTSAWFIGLFKTDIELSIFILFGRCQTRHI